MDPFITETKVLEPMFVEVISKVGLIIPIFLKFCKLFSIRSFDSKIFFLFLQRF